VLRPEGLLGERELFGARRFATKQPPGPQAGRTSSDESGDGGPSRAAPPQKAEPEATA
jgi:hypothetical protein